MNPDPLSSLLSASPVRGSIFCRAELGAPWAVSTLGADFAIFHVVVRGAGFIVLNGRSVAWRAGDVLVLPHGNAHVLTTEPGLEPVPIASLDDPIGADGLPCVTTGGDGPTTSILCGTFRFSSVAAGHLLPQLPPLLHLQAAGGPTAEWLDATLRLLGAEAASGLPGSETVIARLADVLFVQAVRAWVREGADPGWLSALSDPQLARVVGAIHAAPERPWTAASLARKAGMSRSLLFERFGSTVGESPSAYLARWRMLLARDALREKLAVAEVAERVGYSSEAAFSRAFKRHVGESPARWRAAQRLSA